MIQLVFRVRFRQVPLYLYNTSNPHFYLYPFQWSSLPHRTCFFYTNSKTIFLVYTLNVVVFLFLFVPIRLRIFSICTICKGGTYIKPDKSSNSICCISEYFMSEGWRNKAWSYGHHNLTIYMYKAYMNRHS
jgi:hypothetical protein